MPSLFNHRRSRSVSTTRPTSPASSSASAAAAQAFLANRNSQTHLSSAAAAAALRSMTPPPVPVNQIQTKRMMNRVSSPAFGTSAARGRGKSDVQRRSSSASMTERTFRSPSPAQQVALSGRETPRYSKEIVPPVPAVPEDYTAIPPIPEKSQRRSMSTDDHHRTVITRPDRRIQSVERNAAPTTSSPAAVAAKRVAMPPAPQELERTNSNNSVNFSYPRGARPNSPPPKPATTIKESTPSSLRNGITEAEARHIQHDINQTAQQPVKKKKKKLEKQLVEGSHLQNGTMSSKPIVTPMAPGVIIDTQANLDPSPVDAKPKKKRAALTGQSSHFPLSPSSPIADFADSDSDAAMDRAQERRVKRLSGALTKQPSIVREDWEGEQDDGQGSSRKSRPSALLPSPPLSAQSQKHATEANSSRKIEEHGIPSKPKEAAVGFPTTLRKSGKGLMAPETADEERSVSRSPSRSARFAPRLSSDITASGRHEPLGRSMSPAKSALKQLTPSPQGLSPITTEFPRVRDSSPSEATDASIEGPIRRKKSARVSFDTNAEVVGVAAEPSTPDVGMIVSPQNRESGTKWIGSKGKTSSQGPTASEDMEEAMGNRPQLPTFGSVRNNRRDDFEDPSSKSNNLHHSSDHANGGLLSREAQLNAEHDPNLPLPPDVTSVEGTGFASDSDSDSSEDESATVNQNVSRPDVMLATTKDVKDSTSASDVPMIAVQPATPGLEEESKPTDQWLVEVPGSFPIPSDQTGDAGESQLSSRSTDVTSAPNVDPQEQGKPSGHIQSTTTVAEEASDDNDSVYSDAAEDLSDLDGDGFGSIDAVVRSPVGKSTSTRDIDGPDSPLSPILEEKQSPIQNESGASWEEAQARWSHIANQAKRASVQPAPETTEQPQQIKWKKRTDPASKMVNRADIMPSAPAPTTAIPADSPLRTPNQSSAYPVLTTKPAWAENQTPLKKSMRSEPQNPAAATSMRSSMRSQPEKMSTKGFRSSMRDDDDLEISRSVDAQASGTQARSKITRKPVPKPMPTPEPLSKQPLPPTKTDSDSESSFKRKRRSKTSGEGRYNMRRSMRTAATDEVAPNPRHGIRSLSPIARRPMSPVGGQSRMKTTMRGSIDSTGPTLRGQPQTKRPSSLFGFGTREKSPFRPPRPSSSVAQTSKFKSRFGDSDEEEEGARPGTYQSRFADSSDEEAEPASLRPVRGIPRRNDDRDSTDLEDSSDEERRKSKKNSATQSKLKIQVPNTPLSQNTTSTVPASPTSRKKLGLFRRFTKDKEASPSINANGPVASQTPDRSVVSPTSPQLPLMGFQIEAEREAMMRQTPTQAAASQSPTPTPTRGKLQRRVTPQRFMSDTWPMPPPIPAADEGRPNTSDAVLNGSAARPEMAYRQPTTETVSTSAGETMYGRGGKKKKFPLLRRAFGLKD